MGASGEVPKLNLEELEMYHRRQLYLRKELQRQFHILGKEEASLRERGYAARPRIHNPEPADRSASSGPRARCPGLGTWGPGPGLGPW